MQSQTTLQFSLHTQISTKLFPPQTRWRPLHILFIILDNIYPELCTLIYLVHRKVQPLAVSRQHNVSSGWVLRETLSIRQADPSGGPKKLDLVTRNQLPGARLVLGGFSRLGSLRRSEHLAASSSLFSGLCALRSTRARGALSGSYMPRSTCKTILSALVHIYGKICSSWPKTRNGVAYIYIYIHIYIYIKDKHVSS
jgi:hypothetical protein